MRLNRDHPRLKQLLSEESNRTIPQLAFSMRQTGEAMGGRSWQTVYRLVKRGKIAVIPGTRPWMISLEELQRFLREEAVYNPKSRKGGLRARPTRRKPAAQPAEAL